MMELIKARNLSTLAGGLLYVIMMAAGYTYNLTFVQLGLEDFASRLLGLNARFVARDMSLLAIGTCLTALLFGVWMQRMGVGFRKKLQISFWVVVSQAGLTFLCPLVQNEATFMLWLAGTSLALGVGVPVMFSMAVDLVPVRLRGEAAALITSGAYFAAEVLTTEWTFEAFRLQNLLLLSAGVAGLGLLAFTRLPWLDHLAMQHTLPEYGRGRFVPRQKAGYRLVGLIVIMFAIYFVDSLGYLRLLKTPQYMASTWQSPELNIRLFIAGVHIAAALAGGILYRALSPRHLFVWIFGIFALTHLQYSLDLRLGGPTAILSMPMLYATAVSLYTVVNFAVWADISTPQTICLNSAVGVAFSAWTATFLSTGLAIHWQESLTLMRHIQIVDSLAILFFLGILALIYIRPGRIKTEKVQV